MPYTIEKLRDLEERATKGPWYWGHHWPVFDRGETPKYGTLCLYGLKDFAVIPLCIDHYEVRFDGHISETDREAIAYLRTSLPEILKDLEELAERREKEKAE